MRCVCFGGRAAAGLMEAAIAFDRERDRRGNF
jgi:hypothetical protein